MNSKWIFKWAILVVGIIVVTVLFFLGERQEQDGIYDNKSVIYREEVLDMFRVVDLHPDELEQVILPELQEVLTWEDVYYIFDTLGYGDCLTDRTSHVLTDIVSREEFTTVYTAFLYTVGFEPETFLITFWGHVPGNNRISTDQGNYETSLPKKFFSYGRQYEVLCDGNIILHVKVESKRENSSGLFGKTDQLTSSSQGQVFDSNQHEVSSTIKVVLTNDNNQDAMRNSFQIKSSSPCTITCGEFSQRIEAGQVITESTLAHVFQDKEIFADGSCISISPDINHSLYMVEADSGNWSAAYRGVMLIYKSGSQYWIVNQLSLEEYLYGVVPGEMPERFHLEALKAQAICARTYACNMMKNGAYAEFYAHVDDSVNSQVYNKHGENEKSTQAVNETAGVVIMSREQMADIYYFSTSCGFTTGLEAWGDESVPYLTSVSTLNNPQAVTDWHSYLKRQDLEAYDCGSNYFRWVGEVTLPAGYQLIINKRENSGIVTKITYKKKLTTRSVKTENEIRHDLGQYLTSLTDRDGNSILSMGMLPSAWFTIEQGSSSNKYIIYGGGYGHGIGMSQYGAHGMAENGMKFDEILLYYFRGVNLKNLY